jgi:hypothetical protein
MKRALKITLIGTVALAGTGLVAAALPIIKCPGAVGRLCGIRRRGS